jgi:hypothetical protein
MCRSRKNYQQQIFLELMLWPQMPGNTVIL